MDDNGLLPASIELPRAEPAGLFSRRLAHDREVKRTLLLREATRLFARNGFDATSLGDIGRFAGTRGVVQYYWSAKQDILVELVAGHLRALSEAVVTASVAGTCRGRARLAAIVQAYVGAARHGAEAHRVLLHEQRFLPPAMRDDLRAQRRYLRQPFEDAMAEAVPAAAVLPDARKAAALSLLGLLDGQVQWLQEGRAITPAAMSAASVAMALAGLRELLK
jgi:AcrR family transcriptional regulator